MVLLPAALGINLWLLSAAVPLLIGHGTHPAPAHLLLLCGPALLALGLLTPRHRLSAVTLLLAVPVLCLLPGALGLLGGPRSQAHLPRAATALLGAVLLGYLASTCRWLAQPAAQAGQTPEQTPQVQRAPLDAPPMPRRWRRRFALYRGLLALSVLLPVTLLYAADFHPPLNRALLLSLGDQARQGAFQATLNAGLGLLWVALFQLCFLLPLRAHLDHDRQTISHIETLRVLARRGRPRPQFYVAMLLALGSMILLVWRSLHP